MYKDNASIENWCVDNGMQLYTMKCSIVNYKGEDDFVLTTTPCRLQRINVIWVLRSTHRSHGRLTVKQDFRKVGVRSSL